MMITIKHAQCDLMDWCFQGENVWPIFLGLILIDFYRCLSVLSVVYVYHKQLKANNDNTNVSLYRTLQLFKSQYFISFSFGLK